MKMSVMLFRIMVNSNRMCCIYDDYNSQMGIKRQLLVKFEKGVGKLFTTIIYRMENVSKYLSFFRFMFSKWSDYR